MHDEFAAGRTPTIPGRTFRVVSTWAMALCLSALAYGAIAATTATDNATSQRKLQAMAHRYTEALSPGQIAELRQLLQSSRVLEADRLEPATIEAAGNLLSRAGADKDFQETYLDDWPGLWARVGIDVDPQGYAYLMDRVALSQGRKQIYGSIAPAPTDVPFDEKDQRSFASHRNMLGIQPNLHTDKDPSLITQGPPPLALKHPIYPTMPRLRAELLRLGRMDQAARVAPDHPLSKQEQAAWDKNLIAIDAQTLPAIQSIHDRYGFPSVAEVGRSGVQAAFLLIQHAITAPKLMTQAASEAKILMDHGDLPYIDYALLVDRVACVIEHKPQLYGTQGSRIPTSYWYCPIAEPDQVNARRAAFLLQPLRHEDIYGPAVPAHQASMP